MCAGEVVCYFICIFFLCFPHILGLSVFMFCVISSSLFVSAFLKSFRMISVLTCFISHMLRVLF